ncbi:MAG: adenosine deaminase [Candidatus Eisenbacteria bacterium]|uniref:adenosine deaminase n=1 Tax=Eiseniibacteriota bacterium TaxID=2212470 RepID=A0A956NCS8_UNCEI|nr:adenosine deaminase [Candidatus Eisenbacteria bacterium]MCB9462495.1 adenosine deaminase [Candidatus Eisenbacteria bacterium]
MQLDRALLRELPKTDLHCHLDGSLRPETLLELAVAQGVELPTHDLEELRRELVPPKGGDLPGYLTRFRWTVSVLQTEAALERVAFELGEDAAEESVWYLEVRYAPFLHLEQGLSPDAVVEAVLAGLDRAHRDHGIRTGLILTSLRTDEPSRSLELADLAIRYHDAGVVALDLAGSEDGFPAADHQEAFDRVRHADMFVTVHAGEAFGPQSIRQAIHDCGANRIGHGTRLIEDPDLMDYVDDHRIGVEVCLTSNVQTGAVARMEDHPFPTYLRRGLRVSLHTDNRLMSHTDSTKELLTAVETFGLDADDVRRLLLHGFKSTFLAREAKAHLLVQAGLEIDRLLPSSDPATQR